MTKKERFNRFIAYFSLHQPEVNTELNYVDPYELLVAVSFRHNAPINV